MSDEEKKSSEDEEQKEVTKVVKKKKAKEKKQKVEPVASASTQGEIFPLVIQMPEIREEIIDFNIQSDDAKFPIIKEEFIFELDDVAKINSAVDLGICKYRDLLYDSKGTYFFYLLATFLFPNETIDQMVEVLKADALHKYFTAEESTFMQDEDHSGDLTSQEMQLIFAVKALKVKLNYANIKNGTFTSDFSLQEEEWSKILGIKITTLEALTKMNTIPDEHTFIYEIIKKSEDVSIIRQYMIKKEAKIKINDIDLDTNSFFSKILTKKGLKPKMIFFMCTDITTQEYRKLQEEYQQYKDLSNITGADTQAVEEEAAS